MSKFKFFQIQREKNQM